MSVVEDTQMPKSGNEYLLDAEELKTLQEAFILLGMMGGNTLESPYRKAWEEIRKVLNPNPQPQGEDETDYARRIA
jgi:hypothetical protein